MRQRFCKVCEGWHDLDQPWPSNCYIPVTWTRSSLPAPMIIGDTIEEGVQSMADGKIYTSKAKLRRHYRETGHVEVGNDPARLRPRPRPKPDTKAIRDTIQKAKARFNRGERLLYPGK